MSKKLKDYAKEDIAERLDWLCVEATLVLCDLVIWAKNKQLPCIISDAVSSIQEDGKLKRVSSTHREGRAFDISTRGWTKEDVDECIRVLGFKYRHLAAVGQDGSQRLVYFHNAGTGDHLHFQVAKKFSMPLREFK